MNDRPSARISSRKQPKQARSNDLVTAILQAAVQVFAKEGAQRFTTARVAEKAGVSVGSLYQYFPNKAALPASTLLQVSRLANPAYLVEIDVVAVRRRRREESGTR